MLDKLEDSITYFDEVIKFDPYDIKALYNKGLIL